MEILDYLLVARRRLRLLILIPLIATLAAVAYVALSPTTYSASATVSTSSLVGAPWSQYTGPQGVSQFAGAFSANAIDPGVLKAAAADSHASAADLTNGVTVAQVGASSNMKLTYTSQKKQTVLPATRAVATEALNKMFTPQVANAKQEATAAQTSVADANTAIAALGKKYSAPDPTSSYQAALAELSWLQQQQSNLRATGKGADATALDSAIGTAQKKVQTFGPILQQYNDLRATQQAAEASLSTAREDYRRGQAQLNAATASDVLSISSLQATSKLTSGLAIVLPVLGAAIFLAVLVVVLLELLGSARRQADQREPQGRSTRRSRRRARKAAAKGTPVVEPGATTTAPAPTAHASR